MEEKYSILELYKSGVITEKAMHYIDISEKVIAIMKTGLKKSHACREVALNTGVNLRTTYRALRMMTRLRPEFSKKNNLI